MDESGSWLPPPHLLQHGPWPSPPPYTTQIFIGGNWAKVLSLPLLAFPLGSVTSRSGYHSTIKLTAIAE